MPTDLIGTVIGGYRIAACLGEGAVGVVYRGEHVANGRRVAIKVLKEEVARQPEMVIRFFQEARTICAARHPNIVEIVNFATIAAGPLSYIVMELLEGQSLADRIASEGPLAPAEAVGIALQLADALLAVHRHQSLHRDLKPGNVFLSEDGEGTTKVKLLDFGLAKSFGDGHEVTVTLAGTPVGTPAYMAPEQVLGRPLDARADIYGLGVVLYEMLTGSVPFDSNEVGEVLVMQVKQQPPPLSERRSVAPPVSAALEAVVMRCLQKNPADRFLSVAELYETLKAIAGATSDHALRASMTVPVHHAGVGRPRWIGWAIGAIGVALLALFVVAAWRADVGESPAGAATSRAAVADASPDAQTKSSLVRQDPASPVGEPGLAATADAQLGASSPTATPERASAPAVPPAVAEAASPEGAQRRPESSSRNAQRKRRRSAVTRKPRTPKPRPKRGQPKPVQSEPRPKTQRLTESTVDPFAEN